MSTIEVAPLTRRGQDDVVGPITEREHRARTLEAAALEIEVRGWRRGALGLGNPHGPRCLVGGIIEALGDISYPDAVLVWGVRGMTALYDNCLSLPVWNDHHARDAADVCFVLRWRAEEIRDGR